MMRAARLGIAAVTVVVVVAGQLRAGFIIQALDPIEGDSFATGFGFLGFAEFDTAEVFIVSDPNNQGPFQDPAGGVDDSFVAVSVPVNAFRVNPTYALTTGILFAESPLAAGTMSFKFEGNPVGILSLDLLTWDNGIGSNLTDMTGRFNFKDGVLNSFTFGSDALQDPTGDNYDRFSVVPAPPSIVLLGIGGLTLLGCRRRNRQKTQSLA